MSNPRSPRLAWLLAAANATLTIAGLIILLLTLDDPPQGGWGFRGFPTIFAIASGSVGWLIMTRRPANSVGLLLAIIGILNAAQIFLTEYAWVALRSDLPASNLAAWVNSFIWVPTLTLMAGGLPLVFPDGQLPTPRWRPVAAILAIGATALIAIIGVDPDALNTPRVVERIVRVPIDDATLNSASYVALLAIGVGIMGAVASLLRRWRRATGVVREQLKWLALSLLAVVATMWLSVVPSPLANALFIAAIGSVPLAIGIAILRHGLYEIDAVINRTLVFGALTAILTGAFAALLKLLQAVFVTVTGNESDAATVITTLILATAFVPLKHAIESVVERRFKPALTVAGDGSPPDNAVAMPGAAAEALEAMLRRVVREEVRAALDEESSRTAV